SVQIYFEPRSGRATALAEPDLPADVVAHLLALPAVRLAAWRDGTGGVTVATSAARARLRDVNGRVRYEPANGDPLGLGPEALTADDRDLLGRTLSGELPDAPRQLLQLFRSQRAGDLVLAARNGSDFRGPWEIPEHKSGHGSLIAEHMAVPIAASVPLPEAPLPPLLPAAHEAVLMVTGGCTRRSSWPSWASRGRCTWSTSTITCTARRCCIPSSSARASRGWSAAPSRCSRRRRSSACGCVRGARCRTGRSAFSRRSRATPFARISWPRFWDGRRAITCWRCSASCCRCPPSRWR